MAEPARPWTAGPDGITLRLRLTPRAGRDRLGEVAEIDGQAVLRAAVTAPPVEGAANAALIKLVASALGVARSAVTIRSGGTGRIKTLAVAGDGAALATRLARRVDPARA
jgi:uncharacterized protein